MSLFNRGEAARNRVFLDKVTAPTERRQPADGAPPIATAVGTNRMSSRCSEVTTRQPQTADDGIYLMLRGETAQSSTGFGRTLERDDFSSNRHPALSFCLSMIFSENRFPLFRIML
jgi:hypothetical protein